MSRFLISTLVLGALAGLLMTTQAFATPSRILIIRHGEKPAVGNDLSTKGYQRAQALVGLFVRQPHLLTYGYPIAIYAFASDQGHSVRGIETATPLATSLRQKVITNFGADQTAAAADYITRDPAYSGKMVMMVWRHSNIQALAQSLGVTNAPAWNPNTFDRIWVIDFNSLGKVQSFKDIPQSLLPGDSNYR